MMTTKVEEEGGGRERHRERKEEGREEAFGWGVSERRRSTPRRL